MSRQTGRWLDPELASGAALRETADQSSYNDTPQDDPASAVRTRRIYPMGINRNHLDQAISELHVPATITRDEREADAVLMLKSLYRRHIDRVTAFQEQGIPVYVLRSASVERVREALADLQRGGIESATTIATPSASASDTSSHQPE